VEQGDVKSKYTDLLSGETALFILCDVRKGYLMMCVKVVADSLVMCVKVDSLRGGAADE